MTLLTWHGATQKCPIVALMDAASAKPATTNSGALTGTLTQALTAASVNARYALNVIARKSLLAPVIKYKNTLYNALKLKMIK